MTDHKCSVWDRDMETLLAKDKDMNVLSIYQLSYSPYCVTCHPIMLEEAFLISKLLLDSWQMLLLEGVLIPFLVHGRVFWKAVSEPSPLEETQPRT